MAKKRIPLTYNDRTGIIPFNDIEALTANAVKEVTKSLDMVMDHYSQFLRDGDYEFGREQQFKPENTFLIKLIQKEICRLAWLRSKYTKFNSPDSILLWKLHKCEFSLLKQMDLKFPNERN